MDNFRGQAESFLNATKVNLVATIYLYKKLQDSLKFISSMTTGLDPETELSSPYYRNSKMAQADMLVRLSYSDKKIKTFFLEDTVLNVLKTFE